MLHADRTVTRLDGLDDYAGPYASLAADNVFTGKNEFGIISGQYFENTLFDATNGDHFESDAGGGLPTGWVEEDAASALSLTAFPGFWRLYSTSSETSFFYSRSTSSTDPTDLGTNKSRSFHFGPFFHPYGDWSADAAWMFGAYADNAGSANQDIFTRIAIGWDSVNDLFRIRHEYKDGTTQTNSAWQPLVSTYGLSNGYFLRVGIRNDGATGILRAYVSGSKLSETQIKINQPSSGIDASVWGDPHFGISHSRGSGTFAFAYLGAVDVDTSA